MTEESSIRTFADPAGVRWRVLEIVPRFAERRRSERRRETDGAQRDLTAGAREPDLRLSARGMSTGDERRRRERRRIRQVRGPVSDGLQGGWLAFESEEEKRRLAPVPPDWQRLPDEALHALAQKATPVPRWHGRLIE